MLRVARALRVAHALLVYSCIVNMIPVLRVFPFKHRSAKVTTDPQRSRLTAEAEPVASWCPKECFNQGSL